MTDDASPARGTTRWVLGTAVGTAGLYVAFLGWHARMTESGGGACSGPYSAWQVIGLGTALVVLVGVAAWNGHPWPSSVSSVVCLTVLWSADAATVADPCQVGASFWPIGAGLLLAGSAAGLGSVAALAFSGRSALRR